MLNSLYARIATMDLKRPYVWQLQITNDEFAALERAVQSGTTSALQEVVYLAEWYKRCYDGGNTRPVRELDCRKIFEASGINQGYNLFQFENGNKAWQYSIYVLGGVSIPFELGKRTPRFLKELCKFYYGEEGDIDQLGDADRAVAFKESICTRGSLYEYLRAIITGKPPFAADVLADPDSMEHQFIERIKRANDMVLRSKFDLEWIIGFDPHAEYMTRRLRLVLKPESLGGKNHNYLKFERVALWGVKCPERCTKISIGVRFLLDGVTIRDANFKNPLLVYSATGSRDAGFVAWHTDRWSQKISAPVVKFNQVEIVARDDRDKEYVVESFDVSAWMQVFRMETGASWTTRHHEQRVSAVICPDTFVQMDVGASEEIYKKRFWSLEGVSDFYQVRMVYDSICFKTDDDIEVPLFNRRGYDQVVVKLHSEILRYQDGCVKYILETEDEYDEEMLPLLLKKEELVVRHFESRNNMKDNCYSENDCECIEFLKDGRYCEWNDSDVPSQGRVLLRITVKGVARRMAVYYLPLEIVRDCEQGIIRIGEQTIEERIVRDFNPIESVVSLSVGSNEEFVTLDIWRATKHKELIRHGAVIKYAEDGEAVEISYILRKGLKIHDFSIEGYREYDCEFIGNIYQLPEFSPKTDAHLKALLYADTKVEVAPLLDVYAPKWLWINLAKKTDSSMWKPLLYWDYIADEPTPVEAGAACSENDVLFSDLRECEDLCICSPELGEPNPFCCEDFDPVKSFEIATKYCVHYFLMQPLREANLSMSDGLYHPLVAKRGGILTEEDRRGLLRFAEEMGFDWYEKYGITIVEP